MALENTNLICVLSLAAVSQDNVVCLSPRLAQSLGNMGQVCVCIRVTSSIHLIDPNTLQSELLHTHTNSTSPSQTRSSHGTLFATDFLSWYTSFGHNFLLLFCYNMVLINACW